MRIQRDRYEPPVEIPREIEDAEREHPGLIDLYVTKWLGHPANAEAIAAHRAAMEAEDAAAAAAPKPAEPVGDYQPTLVEQLLGELGVVPAVPAEPATPAASIDAADAPVTPDAGAAEPAAGADEEDV